MQFELAAQCTSTELKLRLIHRENISEEVVKALMNLDQDPTLLSKIIKTATSEGPLKLICLNKQLDATLRAELYLNPTQHRVEH